MTELKSHLIHVDTLPEDAVKISNYGKHEFDNLFYSPLHKKLYQQYPKRIREIDTAYAEHGIKKNIYVRTNKGKTVYISNRKLKKITDSVGTQSIDNVGATPINNLEGIDKE